MAAVGYTDTDTFEARISKALGGNAALSAADQTVAAAALSNAYYTIIAALLKRGVTKADADLWAQGPEYQLSIALYFYFTSGASSRSKQGGDAWLAAFDLRSDLKTATLIEADGTGIPTDDGLAVAFHLEDDE